MPTSDSVALPAPPRADSTGAVLSELLLSRSDHDRMSEARTETGLLPRLLADDATAVLVVAGGQVPVVDSGDGPALVLVDPVTAMRGHGAAEPVEPVLLGRVGGRVVVALLTPDRAAVAGVTDSGGDVTEAAIDDPADRARLDPAVRWVRLRSVAADLSSADVGLAVEAVALAHWHAVNRHCPRCGTATVAIAAGHERRCPADGSVQHPRTDPAVIMLVVDRADRVLLARQATWPAGRFSLLAGFVEPGESFEATVVRETREESGVEVGEVGYLGSQPWPFPASVMVAYRAVADSTDITVDGVEISEALWLSADELRQRLTDGSMALPPRLSIARRMIEWWAGRELPDVAGAWR